MCYYYYMKRASGQRQRLDLAGLGWVGLGALVCIV